MKSSAPLVLLFMTIPFHSFASNQAKVVMAKGQVTALFEGKSFELKNGSLINEKTTITTGEKSVAKFQMPDKSVMTLGPNGNLVLENIQQETNKKDPTLINLVSGALRGQVEKQKDDNKDPKMLVRTKSAVMGIRGTDFQTVFNPVNNVSNLVTFEGEVAMAKNDGAQDKQSALKSLRDHSVSVKEGTSALTNLSKGHTITPPFKIHPGQFNAMKQNKDFQPADAKAASSAAKGPALVMPPGLNSKEAAGTDSMGKILGEENGPMMAQSETPSADSPPSGGFIDMNTGLYVPPPPGSTFDTNTGVFVPPADVGSVDLNTGQYLPPAGVELTPEGQFVVSDNSGQEQALAPAVASINLNATEKELTVAPTNDPAPSEPLVLPPDILDDPALAATQPEVLKNQDSIVADAIATISTKANVTIKVNIKR